MMKQTDYEECKRTLLDRLGKLDVEINAKNAMVVLGMAMEVVEATQLKGNAQRTLCSKLMKDVVVAAPLSGDEEELILKLIDSGVIDQTIDLVIDASKGKLTLNKVLKQASGCMAHICCFPRM